MVVVGADVHKRTHTFVAVDEVGRKLGEKVVPATTAGHHDAVAWVRTQFGSDVRWGIEDCRHLSAPAGARPADLRPTGGTSPAQVDGPNPSLRTHPGQV